MASGLDPAYVSLLGLSSAFLSLRPPDVKGALRCLQAVLNMQMGNPMIEARTHLQIGQLLRKETKNQDLAKQHIEQAWFQSQKLPQLDDDVCFESAAALAEVYLAQCQSANAKQILQRAVDLSRKNPYWHCRLLFQLAGAHAQDKDYLSAVAILGAGIDFSYMAGAHYTKLLFMLSKTMLLLLERKFPEVDPLLRQTGPLIDGWVIQNQQHESVAKQQKEYLQIFYLVLQVCYYLMVGQVKSVKTVLKQLQQSIQTITASNWPSDEEMISGHQADNFRWLSKDHLCILVYLVTVMHSMQAGYMDKAQKYTDKAVAQIQKMEAHGEAASPSSLLSSFHVLLLEHIVQCRLVTGNKAGAVQELGQLCRLLEKNSLLLQRHRAQLHTLLGLYAMTMDNMEWAETQLNAALRTSQERELWTFANLNLAIVYLRTRREADFIALLDRISPERLPSQSHSLLAAAYYIQGLHAFFTTKYNDSKRCLRETLKMANAEDLNRLTSCSLLLLGHIFLSLGNSMESMKMVTPAMQLASKIPDVNVQLWAAAILKDLYRLTGDHHHEQEALQMHNNYTQVLRKDHFQASQMPEHSLIQWTDGQLPQFQHVPMAGASSVSGPSAGASSSSATSTSSAKHY